MSDTTTGARDIFNLTDMRVCGTRLDPSAAEVMAKSAAVCLRFHKPVGQLALSIQPMTAESGPAAFVVLRVPRVSKSIRATFADPDNATEQGACGIGLVVVAKRYGLRFAQRSYKLSGNGVDYHMYPPGSMAQQDDNDIFSDQWLLEVSGIHSGTRAEAKRRYRAKVAQTRHSWKLHTTVVAIVEFSSRTLLIGVL